MSKKLNPITGLPYVETINPITGLPFVTPPKNRDYVGRLTGVSVGTRGNSEFESYGIDPLAFYNKEEVRAQRQSLAEKWGNGAAKAGITLVGAIGENTVGTALGIGDWVFSGFDSFSESMANNPIGLLADEANKWAQEELPNYYTQEELAQKGTLAELGSANFWADKFLNGAAYSLGSIASMYLTGGTGLFGATARAAGLSARMSRGLAAYNVAKAVKARKTVRQALPAAKATAARVGTQIGRLEAGFTMSMAEAAVESRETRNSVKETLLEEAKKRKAALTGEMNWENVTLDDRELDQIELQAGEAEGAAFYANMAVLAPTNSIMFNKMIAPFRTSTNFNRVVRDATKDIRTYTEFAKTLPQGIRQAAIAGRVALPFVENAIAEGFQEGMQYAISQGVSDYELRKFKSSGAGELVESLMESGRLSAMLDASGDILNRAKDSFEDPEARSQMLVGAMVGLITGGLGSVRENIQRSKNTKTVLDALNDASFYRLGAKAENINAGVETIRRMIAAEEAGDMVTYNILQNELITTQVLTHIKLGSMDLFNQQMEDAKTMSDEQFKEEFGIDPEVKFTDTFNKTTIVDRILKSAKAIEKGKDIVDNIFQSSATAGAARLFMSKEDKLGEEERLRDEAIYKDALIYTYANLEYIDDAINNGLSALGEIAPSSGLAMNYAGGNRNRSTAQRFKRKTFGEIIVDEEGKETIVVPTDERLDKIIENITKAGEDLNPLAKAEYDKKASEVLELIGKRNTAALALDNLLKSPKERDLFVSRTKAKIEAEKIKPNDAKVDDIINSTTGVKDLVEKSKSVQGLAISPTALQKLRDEHLKRKSEKAKALNRFKAMRKSEVEALTNLTPIEEEARTQHLKTRENEEPEATSSSVAETALAQLAGTGTNANNSPPPPSSQASSAPTSDNSDITMLTRSKGMGEFILNSAGKVLVDDNGNPISSLIDSKRTLNGVPIINGRNVLQLETVTVGTVVELEAIEDDYWKQAKSDPENIGKEIEKMPVYIKIDGQYVGVLTAGNNIGRVTAVEEYLNAQAEGRPVSPVTTVITKKLANNQMNTVVVSNTAESRPWFSNPYEVFGNVPVGVVRYNTDSPNLRVLQVENMHGYENEEEQIQTIAQRTNLDNLAFGQVVFFFKNPNGEWVASVGHTSNLDSEDVNTAVNLLTVLGDPNKGRDAYDALLKLVGLNTLPVEKRGAGPGVLYVSDNFVNEDRLVEFTAPGAYQGDQHTVVSIQPKYLKQLVDAYKQGRNIGEELIKIFKADKTLYGNLLKQNYINEDGKYQEKGVGYNIFKDTKGEDVKFVNSIADHLINTILPSKKRQVEIAELRNDPNYFRNISRQIVKGADVLGHKGVIATDVQKNGNNFVVDIGLELSKTEVKVGGQKPAVRVTPIVPSQPAPTASPTIPTGPPVSPGPPQGPPVGPPPGARVVGSLAELMGQSAPTTPEPGATNLEDLVRGETQDTTPTDTSDPGDLADAPFRLGERSSQTLSETEAKKWLQDRGIPVEFYDSAVQVGTKVAHGYMKNALVYLWRNGQVGTEYHEAFHFVFRTLLNDTQREQLYKEAKKRYNLSKATNLELEEAMAEEFRDYVFTAQETGKGLTGKIKKFFQDIWNYIKAIFVNPVGVEQLFSLIESNKVPKKYERTFTPFKNETTAYSLVTTNLTKDPKAYKAVLASLSHHFINEMQKAEDEDLNLQETAEETTLEEITQPTTEKEVNIEILTSNYTRQSVQNDANTLYLFTDNAQRTSRPTATEENVDKNSWYYKKYKSQTDKPIHFGSISNPTSAVIRGLNNAYPISTMSAYGTNWTNDNFELFKQTIDDEITQIKKDLPKFSKVKIGDFRIGQGGRFAKLPQQHQDYLDNKLLEIGIDNTGTKPKVISQIAPQQKQLTTEEIKPGVAELFESNLELANAVYEALEFNQTSINSTLFEAIPDITETQIKDIYENYVSLMGSARKGKEIPYSVFKSLISNYQVIKKGDTYIFGQYDAKNAVFISRLNSSPSSKELLATTLPALKKQGIDVISFVPIDVANKYQRSGYTISDKGFDYNFKGEDMVKYLATTNPNKVKQIFGKDISQITSEEIENYNKQQDVKYTPVEIKGELIEQAGKDLSKILETYLNQFGIVVKDINQIKDQLNIDELGFADILSKIAYIKDKKDLPPIAGEFIAYMMQYNPLVSDIITELSQTTNYKNLDKSEYFKIIGGLIVDDLQNKLDKNYSKSLIDKLKELIKDFFSLLSNTPVDLINKNVGIISNNILQQNKKLITASLYKPGAFGKSTKQVSLQEALDSDKFGASIINSLSKKGFILTGSTSLGEQGTIQRPNENLLHDIDWVSPFSREETERLFKEVYKDPIRIRDIYGEGYITDTWLIAPEGYKIKNLKKESDYNIITSYDVIDSNNKIVGTYRLEKQEDNNQTKEVVTGVEGKIIDFFSYDKYNQLSPFEKNNILLTNWKEVFKAKLQFARYKDIWDYNRFIPNENVPLITLQQKQQAQQLYSQYLDTIFPDSKVKDIVYHGTKEEFEKFSKDYLGKNLGQISKDSNLGFFFGVQKEAKGYGIVFSGEKGKQRIIPAILNITKPRVITSEAYVDLANKDADSRGVARRVQPKSFESKLVFPIIQSAKTSNQYDGVIFEDIIDYSQGNQQIVFEPEQIHILGSKQDIEGFKKFVKQDVTETKQPSKKTPKELKKARINRATELLGTKENDKGALAKYFYSLAFSTNTGEAISKEQLETIVSFGRDWEAIKDYLDGNGLKVGSPNKGSNIPAGLGGLSESRRLGNARIFYEVYHNWFDVVDERLGNVDTAGWRSGVIDDLKKYGYDLKQKVRNIEINMEMPEEEGVEVNEDEVLHEKIYNITHFEQSPAYRVSLDVRRMFGKMVKPTPNFLGMHTFIDIDTAYKAAVHAAVGLKTFEEMKYAIEEAAKNHPELEAVAEYLNTSINSSKSHTMMNLGQQLDLSGLIERLG